jgi:predicted phosphodiesterase
VIRLLALISLGTLVACLEATPFGTDGDRHDLNLQNLSRLQAAGVAAPPKFAALSDSHHDYDGLADVAQRLGARTDLGLLVHAGDFSNQGLLQEYEWAERALSRGSLPTFVALGNHDSLSSGPDVYRAMYGPFELSFHWAGHRFVFFNSNALEFGVDVPDRTWLERTLGQLEPGQRAVIVTHHAPVGGEQWRSQDLESFYRGLLRDYDVALWVHGHTHGFRLYTVESTPVLESALVDGDHSYAIVTLTSNPSFERCRKSACVPVTPEPE